MADERKPIGYLYGKPIYADDSIVDGVVEIYLAPFSGVVVKKVAEQMAANAIARRLVAESLVDASPEEGM